MAATHTLQLDSTGYQHRSSRLFGHDLPVAGVVHAANRHDFNPAVGDRYKTLCGKITAKGTLYSAEKTVTCRRCLRALAKGD